MPRPASGISFFPREHGATAMLLSPFVYSAILARRWRTTELAALIAVVMAFALKDPLVTLARQRWVWKDRHPETAMAQRWASVEITLLLAAGAILSSTGPRLPLLLLAAGAALFGALAVVVTLKNKQRSEWFQLVSAVVLTSTSLVVSIASLGEIPRWALLLWLLCALQVTAGIFVVHSRLDARIAARQSKTNVQNDRRAAFAAVGSLAIAALFFLSQPNFWIATALVVAAAGYLFELRRQADLQSLQMPLQRVGQQALGLSLLFGVLVVVGLW